MKNKYVRLTKSGGRTPQNDLVGQHINRLCELEDKIEDGLLIEITKKDLLDLTRCIVYLTKYHDYFKPFVGCDAFGTPQVMSMEELLIRTTAKVLGLTSHEEAEEQLKSLKRRK